MLTAAATLSLTGPFSRQGRQAELALRWWAETCGVALRIQDDAGSTDSAEAAYRRWLEGGVDILLGPYGSGLVRRVGPVVTAANRMLWNHGGSADDLARPLVVSVVAPASTYFHGAVALAAQEGLRKVRLLVGQGPFADLVATGARRAAEELGLAVHAERLDAISLPPGSTDQAVLMVGRFDEEVGLISQIKTSRAGLVACVAAGLPEFGRRLRSLAEGVVGPVQWIAETATPEIGPTGLAFTYEFECSQGTPPDYVAAQAAATGFLALEAHQRGLTSTEVMGWRTSTMLGHFQLDETWSQVGHRVRTIRWQGDEQLLVG